MERTKPSIFRAAALGTFLAIVGAGSAAFAAGDAAAGKKAFKTCKACHKIGDGAKNAVGPVLTGVIGRPAGSYEGYKYSKDLSAANEKGLVWTEEEVVKWLESPKDYIRAYLDKPKAKTKMSLKVKDEQKRKDIAAYLASVN